MISWLLLVLRALTGMAPSRTSLAAENAVLRHQLSVLQRERPRPILRPADRVLWIWPCRHWSRWRYALLLIQLGEVLCIKGIPIPYGAPNSAAHIERFRGA